MKLGSRIILSFIVSVLVSVALFVLVVFLTWTLSSRGRYSDDDLSTAASYLADRAKSAPDYTKDALVSRSLIDQAVSLYPGMFFELVAPDLTIQDSSRALHGRADLAGVMQYPHKYKQEWVQAQEVRTAEGLKGYALASVTEDFRKAIDIHTGHDGAAMATFLAAAGIAISLAIACIAAWLLGLRSAQRFNRLYKAFNSLSFNEPGERLDDSTNDELGELAAIFNQTAAKLQVQAQERTTINENLKMLLSEIAHDLRTPLSIITGHAEQIATGVVVDEEEILASVNRIRNQGRYMSNLLVGLTDFAAVESGTIVGEISAFDMAESCRVAAIDILPLIESRGLGFEPDLPEEPVWVMGNEQGFRRAFANILDNAISHGGDGGPIRVSMERKNHSARILVRDQGPGIGADDLERVFEPFYRPDRSRNSRTGGLGLGLHIARTILRYCGGELSLVESRPGCTIFCLELTLAPGP